MELLNDLADANIQIDLYRIADAERASGYDTYNWIPTGEFDDGKITVPIETDSAAGKTAWEKAAQDAAKIVLGFPESGADWNPSSTTAKYQGSDLGIYTGNAVTYTPAGNGEKSNVAASFGNLKAGLYLVLAHGNNVTNYARKNADGTGIITIAQSGVYEYTFRPEIVSIPSKNPEVWLGETEERYNTANTGPWQFDVTAILKPTQEEHLGDLRITKVLDNYEVRGLTTPEGAHLVYDGATFIFEVTGYNSKADYDNGTATEVYHDYVSIVFGGAGSESALVTGLPVGTYVVVSEEHSGKNYTKEEDIKDAVIGANTEVTVSFENEYNGEHGGGGSVTNSFTYQNGEWTLKRADDNAVGAGTYDVPAKPLD
ncbi:MAG: DUF5979 domain-containing protein [Eubacteriales bacterium]|nr:DUF5979 domain-containing protein [Eubacteriales bacterium]